MKIKLYLTGLKGLAALNGALKSTSKEDDIFVLIKNDPKVNDESFKQIIQLCEANSLTYKDVTYKDFDFEEKFDISFACGWQRTIKEFSKINLIVIHDSLLPKYRGFNPLVTALINGDDYVGISALFAEEKYDTGDIVFQKKIKINYPIKILQALEKVSLVYSETIEKIIEKFRRGDLKATSQSENKASYSIWRDDKDYYIDWGNDADRIKRKIDASGFPYDGAKTILNKKIIKIKDSEVFKNVEIVNRDVGKIIFYDDKCPVGICGDGLLKITSMEDLNGKNIKKIKFKTRFGSE